MNQEPGSFNESYERIYDFGLSPLEYKIVHIANNEGVPEQSLAEIIGAQPLLLVRLLKLANFISGLPKSLSTIPQSVAFLGVDQLKALTLGILQFPLPPAGQPERVGNDYRCVILRQIWEHSVGCATFAGRLATKLGNISPQSAFVAGFLHDIGRVLLYRSSTERFIESMAIATEKNIPLTEAETLAAGVNHLDLGALWSRKVELHHSLRTAIQYHHAPVCLMPDFVSAELRNIITLVRLADLACENQHIGSGGECTEPARELWTAFNLTPADSISELRLIKQEIDSAREVFGFRNEQARKALPPHGAVIALQDGPVSQTRKTSASGRRGQVISFSARNDNSLKTEPTYSSKRLRILVVEDHGSLCEMLSLYLIRYGYHVRTAGNGQTALDLISKENVDVVLLDLMLPRVDGFSVLKHVRETREESKPYIIVVSAGASEKDRNRVLELGANEYMPKPFHLTRLLERIQAIEKYLLS